MSKRRGNGRPVATAHDSGIARSPATTGPRRFVPVAALFAVGLALRLVHVWTVRDAPLFELLILDPAMYDEWARAIARGAAPAAVFFQDPLYAYALAALYATLGPSPVVVACAQSVLGAAVGPLLYVAARPSCGRATAGLAGLLAALYLPAVYYDGMLLKTSLSVFWVAVILTLLSRTASARAMPLFLSTGVVLGLAALTRGNLRLMIPVVALWVLLDAPLSADGRGDLTPAWRRGPRLRAALLLLCGAAAVLVPTAVRNRVRGGEWVLTTANVGQNLYIGNNPSNDTGEYTRLTFVDPNPKYEQRDFRAEAARRMGREPGVREASRFWQREALGWIVSEPGGWLRLTLRKIRVFWGAWEVPDNLDYYLYRERAPVLRLPLPGFGWIAPFGLLGAWLAWRRRGWPRLLVLWVLVYALSVVLFFVFSRFRMAMMPALTVLAAYAVVELWHALRRAWVEHAARPRAAGLVVAWLLLAAFVNLPVRARADSAAAAVAGALHLPLRIETSSTGRFNLGVAYAARAGDEADPDRWLALAERELRRARAEAPEYASIPIELGKVLARQQRNDEAIEAYRAAAAIEPGNYRIYHALGLLFERVGEPDAAEQAYRRALELEPRHVASAIRLGELLLALGRPDKAGPLFVHALRVAPENARAADGLHRARAAGFSGP